MKRWRGVFSAAACGVLLAVGPVWPGELGSGYFAGLQGAYAWGDNDRVGLHPPGMRVGVLRQTGPVAGLIFGREWLRDGALWALESEILATGLRDSDRQGVYRSRTAMKAAVGVRLRVGRDGSGRGAPYVAAGLSLGWFDYSVTGGGANIVKSYSTPGYTLAVGWQKPLDDTWSYRLEYRYSGYRGVSLRAGGFSTKATPVDRSLRVGIVRHF